MYVCTIASCETGDFECDSGDCIYGDFECDDYPDCDDSSDEGSHCHSESKPTIFSLFVISPWQSVYLKTIQALCSFIICMLTYPPPNLSSPPLAPSLSLPSPPPSI